MKTTRIPHRIAAALTRALAFTTTGTRAGELDTRIGKLSFENGYPSKDTATKLYDEMDFQRATQAYLWSFPAVSNASIQATSFGTSQFGHVPLDNDGQKDLYTLVVTVAASSSGSLRGRGPVWGVVGTVGFCGVPRFFRARL